MQYMHFSLQCNKMEILYVRAKMRSSGTQEYKSQSELVLCNQIIFLQKEKVIYKWKKYIYRVDGWMLFQEKQVAHGQIFLKPTLNMYSVTSRKKKQFRQY
jgi:hypothetical protein